MSETERLSAEERAAFTAATADCTAGVALRAALDAAEAEGERVVVHLLRERDEARAGEGRLRAALRRFAEVFHEGTECGICGDAWGAQGYEHSEGCAVGDALTEADR